MQHAAHKLPRGPHRLLSPSISKVFDFESGEPKPSISRISRDGAELCVLFMVPSPLFPDKGDASGYPMRLRPPWGPDTGSCPVTVSRAGQRVSALAAGRGQIQALISNVTPAGG